MLPFYGLWFLLLGLLIIVWPKHDSDYCIVRLLWLLAGFGVVYGLAEWVDWWWLTSSLHAHLGGLHHVLVAASSIFLFEFGRRLAHVAWSPAAISAPPPRFLSHWLYVPLLLVVLGGALVSTQFFVSIEILSRYGFVFTGALLTGVALLRYWRTHMQPNVRAIDTRRVKGAFYLLAVSFLLYALVGGIVVPPAAWLPAAVINEHTFPAQFYVPVELARSACGIIMLVALSYVLRFIERDSRRQLQVARADSARDRQTLSRVSRQSEILLRTASDGIHVLNLEGDVVEANDAFCNMLGYTRAEVLGMNVREWDAHFSAEELKIRIPQLLDKLNIFETVHRRKDGRLMDVEISTIGVTIDDEILLYCSSRDITDRKHAEQQLRLVARVFDRAAEGVMITDANQHILTVNDSFVTVTGYEREEVIGKTPAILRSGKQPPEFYKKMWEQLQRRAWWQGEIWNRRKNGELYLEWLSINAVRDESGEVINYIGMFSDVTLIKESRQRMEFLATHDELTGLPNRALFNDHLRLALARSERSGTRLALMFVDLDNFKMINDTLGHEEGDELLMQVSERLKKCVRGIDTVARLGGDEFVVLMEIEGRREAQIMADRILDIFTTCYTLQGQEYLVSSSIGISMFPDDAGDPKILMRHADTAMYRAKEQGKNTYMFFTGDMAEKLSRRMVVENALRRAKEKSDIFLEYQPQIDLHNDRVVGVEALLRWNHNGNVVMPDEFIPIAEESILIAEIDEWVIGDVCRQIREWDKAGLPAFTVSLNVSARQFHNPGIVGRFTNIVSQAGVAAERICLEITEGVLMDVESAASILTELNQVGFRVSVDDFGTGFSSLSYLKRLPIHEVKVDRSFIDGLADDPDDYAITKAIVAMARSMGLKTVAEGVDSEAQQQVLKGIGCDIGQGYLYAQSLPPSALGAWLLQRM